MDEHIRKLFDELEQHVGDDWIEDYEERLVGALEARADKEAFIEPIFALLEKYPLADWGIPGALAHFIESFDTETEERFLLDSLERQPTMLTVFMLNRLINAENKPEYLAAMRRIADDAAAAPEISASARDFIGFQEKKRG